MKLKVPGKLYISGEYGVLHHGHALLAPVRPAMSFEIHPHTRDILASKLMGACSIDSGMTPPKAWKAYQKAIEYLKVLKVPKKNFLLNIQSELNDGAMKLGLGSSGALSVGIIESILLFHGIAPSRMTLFKLSVLSEFDGQSLTSFGDLSVHAFRHWVLYRKFDARWLRSHLEDPLELLLKRPWKGLKIVAFDRPRLFGFAVNAGHASSSAERVREYREWVPPKAKETFTRTMNAFTLSLFHSLQKTPDLAIIRAIQNTINQFSHTHSLSIQTKPLERIIDQFEYALGVPKISGAGGGDNVIGFFESSESCRNAKQQFIDKNYRIIEIGGGIHE